MIGYAQNVGLAKKNLPRGIKIEDQTSAGTPGGFLILKLADYIKGRNQKPVIFSLINYALVCIIINILPVSN